jgi:[protein-PII] uridylyltransferase
VEWLMYCLWDLRLTIGQAIRTPSETLTAAKHDLTIRTSLLDARFVCGNAALFKKFQSEFNKYVESSNVADFVEAKLEEHDARHMRMGDSRYVLEPNLKEGKGGLRDLHTIYWLAKYACQIQSYSDLEAQHLLNAEEQKSFLMARDFLWRVRIHLHLISTRAEERLTFDMQRQVAEIMGYNDDGNSRSVEHFMKEYFLAARTVGNLTRSICAALEDKGKRKPRLGFGSRAKRQEDLGDFQLDGDRIAVNSPDAFREKPLLLITLFKTAHELGLDIHPGTLKLVTRSLWLIDARLRRDDDANDAFMCIMLSKTNPEPILRRMSETGVMGRFIPDFGRVTSQMQFDMYHVFTVDEHTIFALGILHGIGAGKYQDEIPGAHEVFLSVKSLRVLFLALLTHDIAKGRGGDHSVLGEVIARKLSRRFRFDEYEIETCAWLVRHHLLMSRTAFKRDLTDSKTIEDFVAAVQSPERLRLLYLLTIADIRAVGPNVWNNWKGSLLRELYYAAEDKMGASDRKDRVSELALLREELTKLLPKWPTKSIDHYFEQIGKSFGAGFDAATHARIAKILKEAEKSTLPIHMYTHSDPQRAITDIIICTADIPDLFSKTSGAIALAGGNIVSAKTFGLKNGNAIQVFNIQDLEHKAFDKPEKINLLSSLMHQAVTGKLDLSREIAKTRLPYPSRLEVFKVPPRVYVDNKASTNHTVIEVSGRDYIGFLHKVTSILAELQMRISTAHITTYGERAVDVFYVKDIFGMKILHDSKIRQIQETLVSALLAASSEKNRKAG